ncbi:MAG: Crp/Fnr family transcriptional regulator [Pseudoruegeria sp.]
MNKNKGAFLTSQAQPDTDEFILLDGCLVGQISDQNGKEVCVGFYVGPCVVTPNIARTRSGMSLISIMATTDVNLVRIDAGLLSHLMLSSEPIRTWANDVLRETLSQKVDREWCLTALGGAERLRWFRKSYPGYEGIFTHSMIASFLGITPVTFSRLRTSDRSL